MLNFFRNMSFPRAVILVSLVASCVLGYFVREKTQRLDEVHSELKKVPALVTEIQQLGIELTQYQDIANTDNVGSDGDFDPYIRATGADPFVQIGQLSVSPSQRNPEKDIVDRIYTIKPAQKTQKYHQSKIGNFLYKLEADSRRVKVTRFKLTPFKKVNPGEVGSGQWTFEATITSRSRVAPG